MIVVTVDERERGSSIPQELEKTGRFTVRMRRLRAGDYAIAGTVGIERKTGDDFARSIVDGRIFRQLSALLWAFPRPLLLLERLVTGQPAAGVSWAALRGALVCVGAGFGVPILHSSGGAESAELIVAAALQFDRTFQFGYPRSGFRPKGWRKRALHILKGFPGVGPQRAAALLDEFGSVRSVINADELMLAEVPRMGRGLARRIVAASGPDRS